MRILILNWRDIKNPTSGGAEVLTHEMAKLWVKTGNRVIQISAGFPGSKKKELIDDVLIIRLGSWWSVHLLTFFYYMRHLRMTIDIIIDEAHWFPFFSVLYAPSKTVLLVCEVANKLFFELFPYPFALIGRVIEKIYLFLYRNIQTLAISFSTKTDLLREGFSEGNITVLPMGATIPKAVKTYAKEKKPTIIYLGRLNRQKGIEDAIESFKIIKEKLPESKFWIVGSGETGYVKRINRKVRKLLSLNYVKFFGFVSEKKKFELLSKAHILIFPSLHEGWGLVAVEAGVVGTPTVAYNVSGVKDVLRNGRGIVVEPNPSALAKTVVGLLRNKESYKDLVEKIVSFRQDIGWEGTARVALRVLENRV